MASSPDASPSRWRRSGWLLFALAATLPAHADEPFFAARVAPLLKQHCTSCHGPTKDKGDLRLHTYEHAMVGGESGAVITPGDPAGSELYWRVTLPAHDEYVMPSDDKPLLTPDELKILELWIAGGASSTAPESEFPDAPVLRYLQPVPPAAPDWRPLAGEIKRLQDQLGLKLVPRSQNPTDGLILRTASAPARCDDTTLAALAPVAALIVEAELARTAVTDHGLQTIAGFENLRALDLTRTAVTSSGVGALLDLKHLEILNLTATVVDDEGAARLRTLPGLRRLWLFDTHVSASPEEDASVLVAPPEAGAPSGT